MPPAQRKGSRPPHEKVCEADSLSSLKLRCSAPGVWGRAPSPARTGLRSGGLNAPRVPVREARGSLANTI